MNSITLRSGQPGIADRQFYFRPNSCDESVIRQVFTDQHYSIERLQRRNAILRLLADIKRQGQRPLIIDAGANIGASGVYFATTFGGSHIVAIEPDPGNCAVLHQNVQGLDVRCVSAALSSRPGRTRLTDPGLGYWCYRTSSSGGGIEVPQVTIPQILQEVGKEGYRPFLAKIDIEGGEKELFETDTQWVERFPLLIVELHDWLIPGGRTALPFLRAISMLDRDFVCVGENVFSIDNRISGEQQYA